MTCAPPAVEVEGVDPREHELELDQLYAAYVAAHLNVDWAELVLDCIVDRRDELLDRYTGPGFAADERATRVVAWLRNLHDRP